MALGKPVEAIEPLERALLTNPDLFGAQLDLAQAQAMQGDAASAAALLEDLRSRADLPERFAAQIDREISALRSPAALRMATRLAQGWQSTLQLSTMRGFDTNLNNAPSATELTLTLPGGNVTLPLDPSSRPRRGAAQLSAVQWQGVRAAGESAWVMQAEARDRHTGIEADEFPAGHVAELAAGPARAAPMGGPHRRQLFPLRRQRSAMGDARRPAIPVGRPVHRLGRHRGALPAHCGGELERRLIRRAATSTATTAAGRSACCAGPRPSMQWRRPSSRCRRVMEKNFRLTKRAPAAPTAEPSCEANGRAACRGTARNLHCAGRRYTRRIRHRTAPFWAISHVPRCGIRPNSRRPGRSPASCL